MIRVNFENKLKELHSQIVEMGSLVAKAIENSIKAFKNNDLELCKTIIADDEMIDELEKKIESECLWLIAREQPIASDLRTITMALKIASDMERIGDHAEDIADIVMRIDDKNAFSDSVHIPKMAERTIEMVNDAVSAYVNQDLELAKNTIDKDEIVDEYFNLIKNELVQIFNTQPHNLDNAIDLLLIAKYLERIADHAVNICGWISFSQTGKHKNTRIF